MEDKEIIDLFFARSETALRELDLKYGRICRSLSFHVLNDTQDAEDCVNDAYMGIWNAIPPASPDPLLPYLCKIVRNLSLKLYYRKKAARRSGPYRIAMEEIETCLAAPDTVESQIEAKELARIIETFLDTLAPENRVIFIYRYWFCHSCRDIAQRLGLTEKNITVRLTRIRRKLKDYLTEREVWI